MAVRKAHENLVNLEGTLACIFAGVFPQQRASVLRRCVNTFADPLALGRTLSQVTFSQTEGGSQLTVDLFANPKAASIR
jgi:hypothetical protein